MIIPIFTTNLVLFPRQSLTISIDKLHDKQMINDCMVNQKQFGICLIDDNKTIFGFQKPKMIGTIAKIQNCIDVDRFGMQLQVNTIGRRKFKIISLIKPDIELNNNMKNTKITNLDTNTYNKKLYLTASVSTINDIEDKISLNIWENLVQLWKNKIIASTHNDIDDMYFNKILENYDLNTNTPTIDYIYSLSALGASTPNDLQKILESSNMQDLLINVERLFRSKFN